eukprot:TRINITY_DN7141_c0_g1_i2.p3 TRINITY_DN7141_c0_g1~~TRINITY_DN7141_c0_g1_i2.p3  ORF type:complete len:238 (-),score=29.67 TRINITY_DN7141_c0_g1_i2:78-791(-)
MGKQKSKHSTKSKRTLRKQLRLKGHQGLERQNPLDLLEAVSASTVEIEDPNLEILPAKKVKKTPFDSGVVDQTEQRKFSKAQLRKKKQVEARKAQRETLQGLLETLKKHELTNEQRQLLSLTKDMGKRVSRRQELTMHLKLQKMGLPLPKGSRLYQRSQQEEDNNDNSVAEDVEVCILSLILPLLLLGCFVVFTRIEFLWCYQLQALEVCWGFSVKVEVFKKVYFYFCLFYDKVAMQ